jgi:hypothetical protein
MAGTARAHEAVTAEKIVRDRTDGSRALAECSTRTYAASPQTVCPVQQSSMA